MICDIFGAVGFTGDTELNVEGVVLQHRHTALALRILNRTCCSCACTASPPQEAGRPRRSLGVAANSFSFSLGLKCWICE